MPALAVWYIRTAILYLVTGFSLGFILLTNKGLSQTASVWRLLPAHIEFLMFGWTLQLALGVAFWILPRFRSARGRIALAWTAYVLLNIGIWTVVASYWPGASPTILVLGRAIEAASVASFLLHAWPRVKPPGV